MITRILSKRVAAGRTAKILAIGLMAACAVTSCSKPGGPSKVTPDDTCSHYTAGRVIVGIHSNARIEDVFGLFNSLNLSMSQLSYFDYSAPDYSATDIPYLDSVFNTKPYIRYGGWHASVYADYRSGALTVVNMLWNMDAAAQADWLKTAAALHLQQMVGQTNQTDYVVLVTVPVGQEKYWLNALRWHALVTWTELDCILPINGFP